MKPIFTFVTGVFVLLVVASGLLLAQSDPFIGTWKLNRAKSKSNHGLPRSRTTIVEAQGDGAKYTIRGIAPDGSLEDYSFTTNFDGKDSPISGVGQPIGSDSVAVKRINANKIVTTLKRDGKVVGEAISEISKDGQTRTNIAKGFLPNGKRRDVVIVYDKE